MSLVGRPAPGFERLASTKNPIRLDEPISLGDYAGSWLVLLFYSGDFTSVIPSELLAFSHAAVDIAELGAEVLAMSTDSVQCHQAFLEFVLGKLSFPLASDPTGAVARSFGVLAEATCSARHGLFLIDPEGTVRYEVVHDLQTGRSVEEVVRVLQALIAGVRAPAGWRPGHPALLAA